MTYQLDAAALYQEIFDGPGTFRPGLLHELDEFLNVWTSNIEKQGFDPQQADNGHVVDMTPEEFAASIAK